MTRAGLPHSEIFGSKDVCSSPKLIAACHVLHRLLAPRHPPYALCNLTKKHGKDASSTSVLLSCQRASSLSCEALEAPLINGRQIGGEFGGDNRARTGDLLRAKQALSQLSYIPRYPQTIWWA
jgi:hypothetical protein